MGMIGWLKGYILVVYTGWIWQSYRVLSMMMCYKQACAMVVPVIGCVTSMPTG